MMASKKLFFVEDTVILVNSRSDLVNKLGIIYYWLINNPMELNIDKCEIMEVPLIHTFYRWKIFY